MSDDQFETAAAAYVLGALSPADRGSFVAHLSSCEACRVRVEDVAGLPGLLSRVSADEVLAIDLSDAGAGAPLPVPATLLPGLLRAVRRETRRRRWLNVALVGVAAGAVLVAALVVGQRPAPATPLAMRALLKAPITASLDVASVPWGSRVRLRCTYSGPAGASRPYALVVVAADGSSESIGTWTAVPGDEVQLSGATSLARKDIAAVEVRSLTGVALLRLDHFDAT